MAEYFRLAGFTDVKARLEGYATPDVLSGTLEDHRPDLTCLQPNASRTPIIVEVVTPEKVKDSKTINRWSLLASAARQYMTELHFVVPRWTKMGAMRPVLRQRLEQMGVGFNRIWEV